MAYSLCSSSVHVIVTVAPSIPTIPELRACMIESSSESFEAAIGVPIITVLPFFTRGLYPSRVYSSTNSSELIIRAVRPSGVSIISAFPEISDNTAAPRGDLASNSSSTLGNPLVISAPATPPV